MEEREGKRRWSDGTVARLVGVVSIRGAAQWRK
jgi:hypothetical protein